MKSIFKQSIELNSKIEQFLDRIQNSLLLFDKLIKNYLSNDADSFMETMNRICSLESEADKLEAEIKTNLYKFSLLPDVRADVLSLIKSLDDIIDETEEISKEFHIQKPKYPDELHKDVLNITENSIKTAESLLNAARAFFNEANLVSTYINNINFYEHEVDLLQDKVGYKIFNDGIVEGLAEKMQLKEFLSKIAYISDVSEKIGDKLVIFTIKREI